jgi:hypothetical protein
MIYSTRVVKSMPVKIRLKNAGSYAAAIALCMVCAAAGHRGREAPESTLGAYKLEFRGSLTGSGTAAVSANGITITAVVRDDTGNGSSFVAPNLPLQGGRFMGTGTATGGLPVELSGRVDVPSDTVRAARIVATFSTSKGKLGRMVGVKH